MSTVYEPGTITTWVNGKGIRRIAIRQEDGWHLDSNLPEASDGWISERQVEILDPLQLPWKRKYEGQVSANDVLKEHHKRNREELKNQRDMALEENDGLRAQVRELEDKLRLAELAVKDVERLKDAEIAKLKARIASKEMPTADPEQVVQSLDSFMKQLKTMLKGL